MKLGAAGKGFLYILTGTFGAQIVALLALPILSRLYSPESFGYFSFAVALASLVSPVAGLRLETAALLPQRTTEVRALVWSALLSIITTSIVYGLALQSLSFWNIGKFAQYEALSLWVFAVTALSATFALFSQLALRKQQYGLVAQRSFWRASVTAGTQVGWGISPLGTNGLLVGQVLGSIAGIGTMARRTREFLPFPGRAALAEARQKYWRFPVFFAPSALLNSIGLQAPLVFFTLWFGIEVSGQLGMAERIVAVPLALVGSSISQVINAEVSNRMRRNEGGLTKLFLRLSLTLAAFGLFVAVGFGLLATTAIPWLLGEKWELAGQMVQILALTGAIRIVVGPLSAFMVLLQKAVTNALLDVTRVVLISAAITSVVVLNLDLYTSLWLVYSSLAATYLATWLIVFRAVRRA